MQRIVPIDSDDLVQIMLAFTMTRDAYFDPGIATGGPFHALLTLYRYREEPNGIEFQLISDAISSRISTAEYVIERLIESGYVKVRREAGENRYYLSPAMERNVKSYLCECAKLVEKMVIPAFSGDTLSTV